MKTLTIALAAGLFAGCASAVPLPVNNTGFVVVSYATPPTTVTAIELWSLPASAPDYSLGTNSLSWNLYTATGAPGLTNVIQTDGLPDGLVTAASVGTNGARAWLPAPVPYHYSPLPLAPVALLAKP